ncbi:MAG: hypothetical protein MUC95_09990 [Spirochaetes bacterium]|jgi:hypothetical protein|nr:hypothetical protein [Spirochaetota bacterium]
MAHEQGLAEIDIKKIDIAGEFEVLKEFERPQKFASLDPGFNPYKEIVKIQLQVDNDKCIICRL